MWRNLSWRDFIEVRDRSVDNEESYKRRSGVELTRNTSLRELISIGGLVAMVMLAAHGTPLQGAGQPPLPERFDSYVKSYVKLNPEEQKQLLAGQPVTKLLDTDPAKEVAIFGAVWVKAPIARYVAAVKDIEEFEKGSNFLVTKRISNP